MRNRITKAKLNRLGKRFFYRPILRYFFPNNELEMLYFSALSSKRICTFLYTLTCLFIYIEASQASTFYPAVGAIAAFILSIGALLFVGDFAPRYWATINGDYAHKASTPIASVFLTACFPLSFIFLKFSSFLLKFLAKNKRQEPPTEIKEKIVGLIQEAISTTKLDANDKKLIESVVTFRDRIVREVMVPRVNVFSISSDLSIREAAEIASSTAFSRIPVYSENVDKVVGMLMYKDILSYYIKHGKDPAQLDKPVNDILKPILYAPETKKVSALLQEFRNKQMHLAIVVDEYGGTEGIVTIEDILEEIVGEIEDEHDNDEKLYTALPHGGWIVDARMSILDAMNCLNLQIPQDGDYDTIGGYVFHRAGSIPSKGLLIHHDDFELEILSSNDRCVKKVRITPLTPNSESDKKTPNN